MKNIENILLVDDDEIANYLHLQLIGHLDINAKVKVAYNGEDALDVVNKTYADEEDKNSELLIILDINMPFMDGFEFLSKFYDEHKEICSNVHIVLLSSSVSRKDKEMAARFNIDDYIEKPLTEEKLKDLIYKVAGDE